MIKKLIIGSIIASGAIYAASTAGCKGCHGQNFEKKALGASKIVKDMSKDDIVKALKGYKDGSYGGAMKGTMKGQVAALSDADMAAMADEIKGGGAKAAPAADKKADAKASEAPKEAAPAKKGLKEDNIEAGKAAYDYDGDVTVSEENLGLRKATLNNEDVKPVDNKFDAPAPGSAQKFARSYVNAPPLIPHSVEGLLPITRKNNQCLGCHMPEQAKAVGATPIPPSHFTNYRPKTEIGKDGAVVKEGKAVKNTSDVKTVAHNLKNMSMARFNCSQCHVPQANVKPLVKNNFRPDFKDDAQKAKSNLVDVINEGVK